LGYCQNHQIRICRWKTISNSGCTVVTRGKIKKVYRQNILPVIAVEVSKEHVARKIAISCKFMMLTGLMMERGKEKSSLWWVNLENTVGWPWRII